MKRSLGQTITFILSRVIAAAPIAFGVIRAATTGSDMRYLWVALASTVGAMAVMIVGKAHHRTTAALLGLTAIALVAATLLAGAAALLQGVHNAPVLWLVALAFAACSTTGLALGTLSRSKEV